MIKQYQYLDKVNFPSDIKNLKPSELKILAKEVREQMIDAVSVTGGHLGAGLGVVELTIALHYVFDTPNDKIIWDVGHQTYPHKILTGRKDKIKTLRQGNGLSGFTIFVLYKTSSLPNHGSSGNDARLSADPVSGTWNN